MRLVSFRITNFRSINDSGEVNVSQITALLGRNESGKSNLLRALYSLKPAIGIQKLVPVKDFPRHCHLNECNDNTPVVRSRWSLDEDERNELTEILPRANEVTHIEIARNYDTKYYVDFHELTELSFSESDIKNKIKKIVASVQAAAEKVEGETREQLDLSAETFEQELTMTADKIKWAQNAVVGLRNLRRGLAAADVELSERQDVIVSDLEDLAASIANDKEAQKKASEWAVNKMPIFVFLDEYPQLRGHQDIAQYLQHRQNQHSVDEYTKESDRNFEKMCKVAGIDPQELQQLLSQNEPEKRNHLVNRASSVITKEIKRLWTDRPLKVRFNIDSNYLDTFISDPNSEYDVEVNLNERSRGLQWFFSFFITFSADTKGGPSEKAILLLDEPGLYLHAKSQSDLLGHLEKDFRNQIIYTTHSPFMVPTHALDSIRTVNIAQDRGTTVTNDPTGDSKTLFPLQAALGYNLAQSLFVGPNNLVVEGVTDFWILSTISTYLSETGKTALHSDLTITPAGGAQKVSYMVALLSSEQLNVLVLLDEEKDSKNTKDDLVRSKLIKDHNVVFVSEAFGNPAPKEADIEDLLDPVVYEKLVRESYTKELKGKQLSLNPKIPRIAKRIETGLTNLDIEFHKTRPTRLLLQKMANDPASIVTEECTQRFETLFRTINARLQKHIDRPRDPFA